MFRSRPSRSPLLAAAVLAALLLAAAVRPVQAAKPGLEDYEVGNYAMGGDFSLTSQDGRKSALKDWRGKVVVLFFGYTFCPDVCPTTMAEISRLMEKLGALAARVQPVFVTVDPERDTPARLKSYLGNFRGRFVGLTGSEREVTQVARQYQARFARRKVGSAAKYLIDHTAFTYMLDPQGKVRYLFPGEAGADVMAEGAKALLAR